MVSSSKLIGILRVGTEADLKTALLHEDLYKSMGIDRSLIEQVDRNAIKQWVYCIPLHGSKSMGVIGFIPFQTGSFFGHWGFYEKYRGKYTFEASQKAIAYMARHFPGSSIIGMTPKSNEKAIGLAKKLGFEVVGEFKNSINVNGYKENQIITQLNI